MQGSGTYHNWEMPTYVITLSPDEVSDLLIALKKLQKLVDFKYHRADAWIKLMEMMNDSAFGIDHFSTDVLRLEYYEVQPTLVDV